MSWFGKSCSKVVESKKDMESLGVRFETIKFRPDRNEYELVIHLPDCPKDLIKLTYEKPSGVLKLQGKQKIDFVHRFPIPTDCSATKIYGRFRGDVLHIIMPRLFPDWPSSMEKDDQQPSSDRKSTEQVGEDRQNLPARVPESLPSHQKPTDELTGGGKDRGKSPARALDPSSSEQKSTEKLTERGKDHDKLSGRVLSSLSQTDQEATEKLRQRDSEPFPKISERQPSVRKPSSSVKELTENYQKNISKTSGLPPPPPPPPTPRMAAPAPWNREANNIGSRKDQEEKDREASSDQNAKQGDVEPESSVVKSQKIESKLRKEVSKNVEITLEEQGEMNLEKSVRKSDQEDTKTEKMVNKPEANEEAKKEKMVNESKKADGEAKKEKMVKESKAKEDEVEKKEPGGRGKAATLGRVVAKVKETGKTAVEAVKKEENRPMVIIGAAVLALFVIGATLRRKPKN